MGNGDFFIAHGGNGIRPIGVGVNYRKAKKTVFEKKIIKKKGNLTITKFILPDRELTVASSGLIKKMRKRDYDEYYVYDPLQSQECADSLRLDYFMGNYVTDQKVSKTKVKMLWDSGGLQLSRGIVDFVDPIDLAKTLNDLDIYSAVSLDVLLPQTCVDIDKALNMATLVQKMNTLVISEKVNKTKVLNVAHGFSLDTREKWINKTHIGGNNWCLADLSTRVQRIDDKLNFLLWDLHTLEKLITLEDSWLHILGMATHKFVALLVPLTNTVHKITVDATTALRNAMYGTYLLPEVGFTNKSLCLTRMSEAWTTIAPCSCDVCRIVKYPWVYAQNAILLALHNVHTINNNAYTLYNVFKYEGVSQYLKFLAYLKYDSFIISQAEQLFHNLENLKSVSFFNNSLFSHQSISFAKDDKKRLREKNFWKTLSTYREYYKGDIL